MFKQKTLRKCFRNHLNIHPALDLHPQCFLNAIVQCLSHTRGLRDYCLLKPYKQEKFSKDDAKLMEGRRSYHLPLILDYPTLFSRFLTFAPRSAAAFSQVLSGLWDENEGDTVVNPRQFYSLFKEAVPYFSGYR